MPLSCNAFISVWMHESIRATKRAADAPLSNVRYRFLGIYGRRVEKKHGCDLYLRPMYSSICYSYCCILMPGCGWYGHRTTNEPNVFWESQCGFCFTEKGRENYTTHKIDVYSVLYWTQHAMYWIQVSWFQYRMFIFIGVMTIGSDSILFIAAISDCTPEIWLSSTIHTCARRASERATHNCPLLT